MDQPRPAFSFRNLPPVIFLAVGLGMLGSVVFTIALLTADGEGYERYADAYRARMFDGAAQYAQVFLYSLGVFALAKRHVGAPRVLAQVAAWLMFAGLTWLVANLLVDLVRPSSGRAVYDAIGMVQGMVLLAATILLTIAADAWRRVPVAAAGLIVLHVTSYSFPVIGEKLGELFQGELGYQRVYATTREVLWGLSLLFVAGSLAAGGRDQPPDRGAAADGFRLAYGALLVRVFAAIYVALAGFAAVRSPGMAKLLAVTGPLVLIGTQLVLAIAVTRIGAARVEGLPRFRLAVAAGGLFWYAMLQLESFTLLLRELGGSSGGLDREALQQVDMYSVVGPIVATLSIGLVGSAITSFASHRANTELAAAATSRTIAFVAISLVAVALPSFVTATRSPGSTLLLALMVGIAGVVAILLFTGLLRQASEAVAAAPGIPAARVVQD